MWIDFMEQALKDVPEEPLEQPIDMITVRIDRETGLLARPGSTDTVAETFRRQSAPTQYRSTYTTDNQQGESPEPLIDLF
jgi:penicillin-binding protein 1A